MTEETQYGKVRYKRLISNDFCNEEFEVETPVPASKIFDRLHDFEAEGVKFVDRALLRHKDYIMKKERLLYDLDEDTHTSSDEYADESDDEDVF